MAPTWLNLHQKLGTYHACCKVKKYVRPPKACKSRNWQIWQKHGSLKRAWRTVEAWYNPDSILEFQRLSILNGFLLGVLSTDFGLYTGCHPQPKEIEIIFQILN